MTCIRASHRITTTMGMKLKVPTHGNHQRRFPIREEEGNGILFMHLRNELNNCTIIFDGNQEELAPVDFGALLFGPLALDLFGCVRESLADAVLELSNVDAFLSD